MRVVGPMLDKFVFREADCDGNEWKVTRIALGTMTYNSPILSCK